LDPNYNYKNPGRFAPMTCSPRKVSRFAPLNRYYIIIDEVFFDNFLLIIYLLAVCKKIIIHSFCSTLIIYLLVVYKKIIIHSFWSTFVKDLKWNFSCKIYKKPHKNSKKVGFFLVPTQKCMKWLRCCTSGQITSFLMNYASNVKIV
jgi:hypothetical protein